MTTIYVARHGQTDWNKACLVQGQCQSLLNEAGRFEAYSLMHQFAAIPFTSIICSDLKRAKETAAIVASVHPNIAVQVDSRLRERSYGLLEGLEGSEVTRIRAEDTDEKAWEKFGVELPWIVAERFVSLLDECELADPDRTLLLITHSGVMDSYFEMQRYASLETRPKIIIKNTSYFIITNKRGVRVGLDTSNLFGSFLSPAIF